MTVSYWASFLRLWLKICSREGKHGAMLVDPISSVLCLCWRDGGLFARGAGFHSRCDFSNNLAPSPELLYLALPYALIRAD